MSEYGYDGAKIKPDSGHPQGRSSSNWFRIVGDRDRFDPTVNWLDFAFALWDRRHELTSPRRRRTGT